MSPHGSKSRMRSTNHRREVELLEWSAGMLWIMAEDRSNIRRQLLYVGLDIASPFTSRAFAKARWWEWVCVCEREIEREEGEKRQTENEEKGDRYKQTVELSKVPDVLGRCNSVLVQIEPRSRDCFGNDLCLQGFLELPYQENLNQSEYNTRLVFWTHIGWKSGCCSRNSIFRLEVAFSWFWENSDFN